MCTGGTASLVGVDLGVHRRHGTASGWRGRGEEGGQGEGEREQNSRNFTFNQITPRAPDLQAEKKKMYSDHKGPNKVLTWMWPETPIRYAHNFTWTWPEAPIR